MGMGMIMRHRHLEISAVIAAPILMIWVLVIASAGLDLASVFAAIVGYAAADFLCGAIHWYCDEVADVSWRWIGHAFIRPFRDHHAHPDAITKHDVFELCGNNAIVSTVFLCGVLPWASSAPHLAVGVASFALSVLATNVFHSWAHAAAPPALVRSLQKVRIVLSPAVHVEHHVALDRMYCVTSGWTNPILDAAIRSVRTFRQRRG